MHYDILDEKRRALLPLFACFKGRFYLAGGTALALQIGHRDSVDFDFFTGESINTEMLYLECEEVFASHAIAKTQEEKNTLGITVDDVRISFMSFHYPLVRDLVDEPYLALASLEEIACMKCSAITGRSAMKDYIDIFFLLKQFSLAEILVLATQKFSALDQNLILKSIVYFDDVREEPIRFTSGNETLWLTVQDTLKAAVTAYEHAGASTQK